MKILICGVGAIGSNLTSLIVSDVRDQAEITILDMDTVEERNYRAGTQAYFKEQKGQKKVDALQYAIFKQYGIKIQTIHGKLGSDINQSILHEYDVIVDCFDNKEAREIIHTSSKIKGLKKKFVHLGFSTNFTFNIQWGKGYEVPEDIEGFDICEATGAASFVKMVATIGSIIIQEFLYTYKELEVVGNKFGFKILT